MKKVFVLLSFALPLIIYILTLAPDVYFTDSGELASVATTLGIAHPTGYPLFTLIGYIWANLLPWTPIYNLNLMAAVFTALSSMFLYFSLLILFENFNFNKRIGTHTDKIKNWLLALFITLGYAFALTTWQQATAVEVYSLQLFLINLFIFTILKAYYSLERTDSYLILSGLILGLGFANHLTSFMLIPLGIIVFFAKTKKYEKKSRRKLFLFVIGATLLSVLLYLYLPFRSAQSPTFNWGEVSRSWDKFIYHVTGAQYQVWMFSDGAAWKANLALFFKLIPSQITWIGIVILIYGFFILHKGDKVLFYSLLSTAFLCLFYSLNYSIHDIDSYFVTAYIVLFILVAIAAKQIINYQINLLYLFLFIPLFNLYINYSENNLSKDYTVSEYYRLVTQSAQKDALVLSSQWDFWVSAFWYKDKVKSKRQDITLIDKELLRRTWYVNSIEKLYPKLYDQNQLQISQYQKQLELFEANKPYDPQLIQAYYINMINSFIDNNYSKRPIYLTFEILQSDPDIAKNYIKIPEGFLIRLSKTPDNIELDYSKFDVTKLANSVANKEDEMHKMAKQIALVNLNAAKNYYQYKGDNSEIEIINKKINTFYKK